MRELTIIKLIPIFVILVVLQTFLALPFLFDISITPPVKIFIILLLSQMSILLVAWGVHNRYKHQIKIEFDIRIKNISIQFIVLMFAFILFSVFPISELVIIISKLSGSLYKYHQGQYKELITLAQTQSLGGLSVAIFVIAVLPGIIEEFFFRGVIQKGLCNKYGPKIGILSTSIFFSLIHLNPITFPALLILALVGGYIYYKTNNLIYPILMHFFNNLLFILLIQLNNEELSSMVDANIETLEHIKLYLLIPTTLSCLAIIYLIIKKAPHLDKTSR